MGYAIVNGFRYRVYEITHINVRNEIPKEKAICVPDTKITCCVLSQQSLDMSGMYIPSWHINQERTSPPVDFVTFVTSFLCALSTSSEVSV